MLNLHESAEMYLETIYILSQDSDMVHSTDVAAYMGYSKPSVSRAVGLLKQSGLLTMAKNGSLQLTDSGCAAARKIFERHTILSQFLTLIGVNTDIAAQDACKIEHIISDETIDAIKIFIKKSEESRN